jgi:hypothetical protein
MDYRNRKNIYMRKAMGLKWMAKEKKQKDFISFCKGL